MTQAFRKAITFGDIHFGKKNNDKIHNQDCHDFVSWILEEKERHGADTCIFTGDWHDNRHSLHVSTMNYSLENMERLGAAFDRFYFIVGNHDLYYREKRDLTSVVFGRNLKNVEIITEPTLVGDTLLCPWLVGKEWETVKDMKARYVFGHFELPHFMMNAQVEMPDHGGLNADHFVNHEYVFSGHFHQRQNKKNVWYIGNAFPHNFSDAWDDNRGYMLMEYGGEPQFYNWADCPKYRTLKLSELLEAPEKFITPKTYARVMIDIEINFEEAQFIKETFQNQFEARRIDFIPQHKEEESFEFAEDVVFQTVDQIVIEGLTNIESTSMDRTLLIEIYKGLPS